MTGRAAGLRLPAMVLSRTATVAIFMTYPACLFALMDVWGMTATQAGLVQGGFTVGFALSLLAASLLCDRHGARAVFRVAVVLSAMAALGFAVFTRSYETALITAPLVGLSQGGTYTPAIMLASVNARVGGRNAAVGWVLAGMSAGYVLSIVMASTLLTLWDYRVAFWGAGVLPLLGWGLGWIATARARDTLIPAGSGAPEVPSKTRRRARLLTIGYIGHVWELFGMWAWVPAFLAAAALVDGRMSAIELGVWTALALHLSGFVASFLSGYGADRFGVRPMLIGFALLGTILSLAVGWLIWLPLPALLAVVALYGFSTIGDSAVLSSAMTSSVSPRHLGKVLGLRSVLGIGAGAISPVSVGLALDLMPSGQGWGAGFSVLAFGGLIALVAALKLERGGP